VHCADQGGNSAVTSRKVRFWVYWLCD